MNPTSHTTPTASRSFVVLGIRAWLLRAAALVFVLAMGVYGVIAIDTGYVNFKGAGNSDVVAQRQTMVKSAEDGTGQSFLELLGHSGLYLATVATVLPPKFAYGEKGLSEAVIHYAAAPKDVGMVLSLHNTMGGILMLAGTLQFWPLFRRRYPRWHRAFGVVYVTCATIGMFAAIYYMANTPLEKMYDGLTFTVGVWFLAFAVLTSVWLSMYHLWRREIAQHQAWMAISYGFLLTAPLQRYLWVIVGLMNPGMRQMEAEFAATAWLIPFSFLIGYGLFTVNRLQQERRPAALQVRALAAFPRLNVFGRGLGGFTLLLLAIAIGLTVLHFLLFPGLASYLGDTGLVPAGVIAQDLDVIVNRPLPRLLFALATCVGLGLGLRLLWQAFIRRQAIAPALGWGLVVSSLIAGLIMTYWGFAMGLPSFATLAGGANWLFGGLAGLGFAALLAWALVRREQAWIKEWSLFAVILLLGAPSFYFLFPLMATTGIPAPSVAAGDLYRLASYGQWFLLLLVFVYSVYSSATQERFAK